MKLKTLPIQLFWIEIFYTHSEKDVILFNLHKKTPKQTKTKYKKTLNKKKNNKNPTSKEHLFPCNS